MTKTTGYKRTKEIWNINKYHTQGAQIMKNSSLASVLAILFTTSPISALDNPVAFSTDTPSTVIAETIEVGDFDFGPNDHFGTPALRGMREDYFIVLDVEQCGASI